MKILIIHNSYFHQGGEDEVVLAEKKMLESYGHQVILYQRTNREIEQYSFIRKISFFFKDIFWSRLTYQDIQELINKEKPDIAHFHNVLFVVTASAYDACYEQGIPIIQTLHNFRFLCPIAIFYRQGKICEECTAAGKIHAVFHKCWKNSFLKSFLLFLVVRSLFQKVIVERKVKAFICLTKFAKDKFLVCGLPQEKISIKSNFLGKDPGLSTNKQTYAIFVGALRDYKGVKTLIRCWRQIKNAPFLKVVGSGPLEAELKILSKDLNVEFVGQKPLEETLVLIKNASFLILPSECYESFPRVIVEAYACGIPVIASDLGALKEIVEDGKTGLLFKVGDVDDLALKIHYFMDNPKEVERMGNNAQQRYEKEFTAEKNYERLIEIYRESISRGGVS